MGCCTHAACTHSTDDKGDSSDCKMDGFEILSNGFRLTGTRVLGDAEFRGQAMAIFGDKPGGENGAAKLPGISCEATLSLLTPGRHSGASACVRFSGHFLGGLMVRPGTSPG